MIEKKKIQIIGFICLIIIFIFAVTTISLAGVHFRYTSTTWTNNGWAALGAVELASMILVWILIGFGIAAFVTMNKICLLVFSILNSCSFLFTLAAIIFCFMGTKTTYWPEHLGCNAKYDGLFKVWESVDTYLQTVDSLFCSNRCPCYFNSTTSSLFTTNSLSMPFSSQWTFRDTIVNTKIRFQDCDKVVVTDAYNKYLDRNAYYNHSFNPDWFHTYYKHIEEYFKCTGFCGTTYYDMNKGTTQKIVKYLFSDVTQGIPENIGCLPVLLDWVTKTLNAFAAVACFMAFVQLILVFVGGLLCWKTDKDEYAIDNNQIKQYKKREEIDHHPIAHIVDRSIAKQREIENSLENDNINLKESQREILKEKEKELLNKKNYIDDKINIQGQTPLEKGSKLENIETPFAPSDAQKNEVEFKFNPSTKQ